MIVFFAGTGNDMIYGETGNNLLTGDGDYDTDYTPDYSSVSGSYTSV